MRIAFISDIHGHYQALKAVLSDIEKSNVRSIVCLGDVVSLGIQPREVIELLQKIDCQFILGNHDEPLIDYSQLGMLSLISEEIFHQNIWALKQITEQHLDFIRDFKKSLIIEDNFERRILCFHGTPICNHEGISQETCEEKVNSYCNGFNEPILVCGHTHKQMIRKLSGKLILNPGSVGSVFNNKFAKGQESLLCPWAEYGILDLSGAQIVFEMKKVPFDIDEIRTAIAQTDFPYRDWWAKQYI
ncbi:MAG TPA: metallophosphoesterase family protein [Chitinispirillaceae bacterium]|nr:metallophosphoesterase family protein [Chitinispirillaceae bacterium]